MGDDDYIDAVRRLRGRLRATALVVTFELGLCAVEGSLDVEMVRERLDQLVADGRLGAGERDWQYMGAVGPSNTGDKYYWPNN